ncbi:unnamed protein product [Schistosoma curassoni]|nr:unnamed protein product [Schistosoma curassoni]
MSSLIDYVCRYSGRNEWVYQWNQYIPLIPDCGSEILFPFLLVIFTLLGLLPYTVILIASKSSHSRLISCLYLSKSGLVCISFLLNAVWILYVVLEMREFGLYSFVRPGLISLSLVSFIIVMHYERKRNTPNSGVSFYYLLLLNFVWICCCWNHTVHYIKHLQNSTMLFTTINNTSVILNNNNTTTTITLPFHSTIRNKENFLNILDYINLLISFIIFILNCNSERRQCLNTNRIINITKKNPNIITDNVNNNNNNSTINPNDDQDLSEHLTNQMEVNYSDENVEIQNLQVNANNNNNDANYGLDMNISEGGSNISLGQRQLVFLDYDRILVLEDGQMKELDSPKMLLQNKNSAFYSLAKDAHLVE